jgi:site-specific DNA recombinase
MPPKTRLRAVTYCRISDDRQGQALGVERQGKDCQALLKRRGWSLAGSYVDNDLSAYSGKPRPGYQALLAAIEADQLDAIVAWDPDRLHRSPAELEHFIALVEKHAILVETVQAGHWDLSTPAGRMIARQLGTVARYESEHKAERVRRALEQRAGMGRSHGKVPYGWTRQYAPDGSPVELVNEAEARVVRDMAKRIVQGHSLRQIVADLNAEGIPSPNGQQWEKIKVRAVVLRERNVGLRVHRGEVVGEGTWPPILDRTLWEQVRAVLADPARRTSTSSSAVHLLSGLARCGVCGGSMRASLNRQTPSYRCAERGCVSRNRTDVDAFVEGLVLRRLARPDAVDLLAPRDDSARRAIAEAAELRAKLDNAADDHADGKIDRGQLLRITERLRPRLEAAQDRARNIDNGALLGDVVQARDPRTVWEKLPLTRQRAIIDLLLTVRVMPAYSGPSRKGQDVREFDPAAVQVTWNGA